MICADELKNIVYKDLTEAARETMRKIVDHLESVENPPETIQQKLLGLRWNCAWSAANSKYGYLKKPLKDMVDSIVDTFQKESSFCLRFTKTFRQKIAAFGENGAYLFRHISAGKDSAFPLRAYGRNAQSRSGHKNAVDLQFARWTDRSTATSISLFA